MSEPQHNSENKDYERHYFYIEKKINTIEMTLDLIRRDITDLQKSDSRQLMILIVLVTGLLGLDITKVSFLFQNIHNPGQNGNIERQVQ